MSHECRTNEGLYISDFVLTFISKLLNNTVMNLKYWPFYVPKWDGMLPEMDKEEGESVEND